MRPLVPVNRIRRSIRRRNRMRGKRHGKRRDIPTRGSRAGHRHAFGQCPLTRRVALPVRPARTLCHSHTQRNRALSHPRQRRGQRGRLDLAHGGSRGIQARVAPGQHRRARQGTARPHATLPRAHTHLEGRHRHGNRTRQHRHHRNGGTARARRPRHLRGRCRDATRRSPQARARP